MLEEQHKTRDVIKSSNIQSIITHKLSEKTAKAECNYDQQHVLFVSFYTEGHGRKLFLFCFFLLPL